MKKTLNKIFRALAVIVILLLCVYSLNSKQRTSVDQTEEITELPQYEGQMYVELNGNVPFFTQDEINDAKERGQYETYGALDVLGRCTGAIDNLGFDTMPEKGEKRKDISDIHPTAWKQARYDCIDSKAVMTRTHLVGWMLSAENANKNNLITGTRYMNADAMTIFELKTVRYIERGTDREVLYRVTPVFEGNNLMASGVVMEGYSLKDDGKSICYCVYLYNVQPGIWFDYSDGSSEYSGIFMDTDADSVITDGINLDDYVMCGTVIHSPSCSKCDGGIEFKGDVEMEKSWPQFGYSICECIGEDNIVQFAEAA